MGMSVSRPGACSLMGPRRVLNDKCVVRIVFGFYDCELITLRVTYQPQSTQMTEINGKPRE